MDFSKPFAFIKKRTEESIVFVSWPISSYELLADIPKGNRLSLIPYHQITEKGFKAQVWPQKIMSMAIQQKKQLTLEDVQSTFPEEKITLSKEITYKYTQEEYETIVQKIITNEIGNGEWSSFVIGQRIDGQIDLFSLEKALSIYKKLLATSYGSYRTFLFFDGNEYHIGATPERHLSKEGNIVRMNPISGTFRKRKAWYTWLTDFTTDFVPFLENPKEINELFMVVDEELKMMAKMCSSGGMIVWPLLKEMNKLIHTEYLLRGQTTASWQDLLRMSMRAPTLTGSPMENACAIIEKYESEPRGRYAWSLVLSEENGDIDSCIIIRTLHIDIQGNFTGKVGATLVRDSDPTSEYKEAKTKIAGILSLVSPSSDTGITPIQPFLPRLVGDDVLQETLQTRNQNLSAFWFFNQEGTYIDPILANKKILLIDNEDEFIYMMGHMLKNMGMQITIKRRSDCRDVHVIEGFDLVCMWPWPGDPSDGSEKMQTNLKIIESLSPMTSSLWPRPCIPFFCICLGHQLLCHHLGIPLRKKQDPSQGVAKLINYFGEQEWVWFYNTFTGVENCMHHDIDFSLDEKTKEIHAMKWKDFFSLQFHPESILTKNGYAILKNEIKKILSK